MRAKVNLHNHFLLELRDAKTGRLVRQAEAENVVTNEGRKRLAQDCGFAYAGSSFTNPATLFMPRCLVGSGTNTPAPTDTQLGVVRAYADTATTGQVGTYTRFLADEANQVWWIRRKYQFSEVVANYGLTEVGLSGGSNREDGASADTTSAAVVHTRALFRDANGDPITVTKTGDQIMTVTATVYLTRGAVDEGMRLLNKWFTRQVNADRSTAQLTTATVRVGSGNAPPTNADTALSGSQVAVEGSESDRGNAWFWDGSAWTTTRPASKPYTSTIYTDFDLSESVGTYSEVLFHQGSSGTSDVLARLVYPCGTVQQTSYTKTNQEKVRHYLEITWG